MEFLGDFRFSLSKKKNYEQNVQTNWPCEMVKTADQERFDGSNHNESPSWIKLSALTGSVSTIIQLFTDKLRGEISPRGKNYQAPR